MLLSQALEIHAEAPMRIALRESAVRSHLRHLLPREHLEHRGIEIQPFLARIPGDDIGLFGDFLGKRWIHGNSLPCRRPCYRPGEKKVLRLS